MILSTLLLGGALASPPASPHSLSALRVDARHAAPTIDGKLDDPIWAAADSAGNFIQREPAEGRPAKYPTTVRVVIDDDAVYVAVRAIDPEPDRIMAQLTRRDEDSSSDWIVVGIDSHHDRRTGYGFAVNPAGVKRDFMILDGADDDYAWDAVWESAARRDEHGWTVEYRIPLAALRFSTGGDGVWGFQVMRVVQRDREMSTWTGMKRDEPRAVAVFGELRGLEGIRPPRRLEVLPYTVSRMTHGPAAAGNPFRSPTELGGSLGADVKYGLTPSLTLDATVNPDFGQVEADPSQVNLSAFETFLPEKRPFFTEGADIFRFGIALGDGDNANEQLFYSRRIGRSPQGDAIDRGGFSSAPDQTTILGAAKLSGRTEHGWSVGLLDAVTSQERADVSDAAGGRFHDVVEPLTNYAMGRLRRDLNEGRTSIGLVATSVFRRLDGTEMDWLRSSALAGGVDFSHRWRKDAWLAQGWALGSTVRGSTDAILRTQLSSSRYFQRPDADYVEVDSSATSLNGWGANALVMKVKGNVRGGFLGQARSPGFEVNDMGYQRRADDVTLALTGSVQAFQPHGILRRGRLGGNLYDERDFGWDRTGGGGNVNMSATFLNYWDVWGGVEHGVGAFSTDALRGGPLMRKPAVWDGWSGFSSDYRKPFTLDGGLNWWTETQTDGHSWSAWTSAGWRVNAATKVSLNPSFSLDAPAWQYVDQVDDAAGAKHYVFGGMRQKTAALSVRLAETFTPNLSLQVYAQPFVSAGRFDGFKEVTDPRAATFQDRFHTFTASEIARCGDSYRVNAGAGCQGGTLAFGDPDFNVRDLNVNAVLRWEYRLGSTLYVAWSHARGGSGGLDSPFRLRHDVGALFREPSTNVLLVKVNYWLHL
jgi:hypothetical protein